MVLFNGFLVLLLSFLVDNNQDTLFINEAVNPGVRVENVPYIIERNINYIELDGVDGIVFVCLFVSDDAKIDSFSINVLKVFNDDDVLVDFIDFENYRTSRDKYPENVKQFYSNVSSYIHSLKLIPREDSLDSDQNEDSFYLRIMIGAD